MIRPVTIGALLLIAIVATALYAVSYEVKRLEARLGHLGRGLAADRAAIRVLEAEWSYLDQPERLQGLAERYLDLAPLAADQIHAIGETLASLPRRLERPGGFRSAAGVFPPVPGTKPALPARRAGAARPGGGTS